MADQFSHFFEFDPADDTAGVALCGLRKTDDRRHSAQPTCGTCADILRAEDRVADAAAVLLSAVLDKVYAAMGEKR